MKKAATVAGLPKTADPDAPPPAPVNVNAGTLNELEIPEELRELSGRVNPVGIAAEAESTFRGSASILPLID